MWGFQATGDKAVIPEDVSAARGGIRCQSSSQPGLLRKAREGFQGKGPLDLRFGDKEEEKCFGPGEEHCKGLEASCMGSAGVGTGDSGTSSSRMTEVRIRKCTGLRAGDRFEGAEGGGCGVSKQEVMGVGVVINECREISMG